MTKLGLFPDLPLAVAPPPYGQGSTLDIARYEIAQLKRGSHVSTSAGPNTIGRWLAAHGIDRKDAQPDMRNSLQRMAGHNPIATTSPRTEVDERVVPCEVRGRHIPAAAWAALGGAGRPQATGYLIADAEDVEWARRWWEHSF